MRKILKGAVGLLIAITMVFSTVAIADTQTNEADLELTSTPTSGSAPGAIGSVVWDNGMDYENLGAAQIDEEYPFEAECADDFHFEEDTEVCDVHWVGGYWQTNYQNAHWPWQITFYYDDGSGERPGDVFLGPFVFDNTQYTETLLEDTGTSAYYEFGVDLPENYIFPGCHKFWISIQGIGIFPPQSGWGLHQDPINLHEAVFRSELLGYPDWTDTYDVFGYSADMCFQLTTKQCEPSVDVEKYVWDAEYQEWVDADTKDMALDVAKCDTITYKIVIHNDGTEPLYDIVVRDKMHDSVEYIDSDPPGEHYYDPPYHYIEWYFNGPLLPCEVIEIYITAHVVGKECSYDENYVMVSAYGCGNEVRDDDSAWIHIKGCSIPILRPFLHFLETHPNMFPLLQLVLKKLGVM
jgi:hypothetical protein